MADKPVGKITHYYDKIGVAVVELDKALKVGNTIKIVKGDTEFTQAVDSMQIDRKEVKSAKKGDSIGLKIDQPIRPGAQDFLEK
jgi:putative protease